MYSIYAYEDYSGYVVLYQGSSLPDRYPVEEATLSEALNASPVLTFSIYDGHPALAALLRLIGAPGVYENSPTIVAHNESADDEQVFSGRIYSHQFDDVTGKHTFVCEGLLSRLNDYPVAPYSYSGTVAGYLQALFDHSEAAMTVGNVTVADANDYITRSSETPVNLWDEIADKCIGSSLGGYIEIRDGYIVDWLAAPSASTATQDIEKGINLLGLDVEEQPRAKFSGVLVYGAEAGWENQYGQTMYYNLYQYHDWESSLPSGYTMGSYILWNDALREEIGDRVEILHYPDITQPLNLMRRAVSFLQNQADVQTIQVSAIDMVDAGYGEGIDNIQCGQVIHITGKTVDADRMVTAITRDLLDPSNTTFEFGGSYSISGSGSTGGSGGGGSTTSPHFWHTDVENSQFSPSLTEPYTGMSTLPLEDALTDIVGAYSEIDGGAVWLVNTPKHNNVPYDASALQIRANNLNARIVSASLPLYEAYLTLMGTSAMLGARYTNTTRARVSVDGYNGNVDITAINAVNVSGDTNITGNLSATGNISADKTIYANDAHVYIRRASLDTTAVNNGISTDSYLYHGWLDKNSKFSGWCGNVAYTDGRIATQLAARRVNGTANLDNSLVLAVNPNGNRTVTVSDAAPWLDALRINTWENVAISNFATAASGWSFVTNECQIQYNEALGALRCRIRLTTSAAQTAGQKTVFTVAPAYRPKTLPASLSSLVSNAQAVQLYTTGGAAVNVSALSANANLYFNGVYFIGA